MSDLTPAARKAAMLEKVRKLLAMARDGRGNEHEEAIAMRQANKIMAEHGIVEAEVDMAALEAGEMVFGECKIGPDGKAPTEGRVYRSCPRFVSILSLGVARFTETNVVRKTTDDGEMVVFRGEKSDALLARWLFGVLVQSIQSAQKRSGWTKRGEASEFRDAAARTLQKRLGALAAERREMYQAAQAQSNSRALAVVDRKRAIIADRFGEQRVSRTTRRVRNEGAREAGTAAGCRINIPSGRPLEGAQTKGSLQ